MVPDTNGPSLENDPSTKYGRFLAHPPPGEEIAISGISGQFPLASNIEEFKHNLYNKVDMISRHSHKVHPEMPLGLGKLNKGDISKFDCGFFGIHKCQAKVMSQMGRLLLEKCIECIFDAGLHPSDVEGTKTGVFIGICFTESETYWCFNELVKDGNAVTGNSKSMLANRISYFLKLKAPSFNVDTACSSTLYALDSAYNSIRKGDIDQALVCGSNILLSAGSTLQFARLGVLSQEGIIRAFDENGKGYVRAEAISAILLQKVKNCKRIYAKILHTKTNCDGYKEEGITYPSGEAQLSLLKEIYWESGVNPLDISFIEAHGTGTPVGDPEELNCIDTFFTEHRTTPLLIGSVKSSIGHTEPVSGICSIVKSILAFETNLISPNINFKTPRKTIPGLLEGRMKVVVEKTPFQDQNGQIGVSSFGFGGGNAHAILKWNTKKKIGNGKPWDDLPRIICVSGRTREAVHCLLADVADKFDFEHIGLIHNSFRKPIKNHLFRGFTIVSRQGVFKQSIETFNPNQRYFYIHFGGISKSSGNLTKELLQLPLFSDFTTRIEIFLMKKQLNFDAIVSNFNKSDLNHLLAETIKQLYLTELLIQLDINFKGVSADSFGKLICGYFENSLTLEQVLECIYAVGKVAYDIEAINNENIKSNGKHLIEYEKEVLTEFKKILQRPKQDYGCNGTEVKTTLPEFYVEAIFNDTSTNFDSIPTNSVLLEIGQCKPAFYKKGFKVERFDRTGEFQDILEIIGSLYEYGMNPQVQKLYPKVQFPVSRGTPMISPKIKWKHDYEYFVPAFDIQEESNEALKFSINLSMEQWGDLGGHIVDGRTLFPATGYLFLAWSVISEIRSIDLNQLQIVFENCKFKRACTIPNKSTSNALELSVMIQRASGKFEVSEGNVTVVTGQIQTVNDLPELDLLHQLDDPLPNNDMLNSKDVYKELRLRGYNYKGLFQSLTQCNKTATSAKIRWANNWIAFIDNMLQLKILAEDTRLLYVPISISRLTINPIAHLKIVKDLQFKRDSEMVDIPVEFNPHTGAIRSAGIEIYGLLASSIPRKKLTALPVLEKYEFVPNMAKLTLEQSVRVFMQVALENNCGYKINVAELVDEASRSNQKPLGPIIEDALKDLPLVTSDITMLSNENLNFNMKLDNKILTGDSEYTFVVGSDLFTRKEVLEKAINATADSGYIISREPLNENTDITPLANLIILNISETDREKLVLLKRHYKNSSKPQEYINVSTKNKTFNWLKNLKDTVNKVGDVIVWCQNEPLNGIIGLVNCIRREPGCQNVRTLFILDQAPDFDPTHPFYRKQLEKNMLVNIYMNAQWGTYRHFLLENLQEVDNEHCYANSTIRGDLSSIQWMEGPLSQKTQMTSNESLVDVYYSSLNFRDVMTASGRINVDVITRDRREQECVQGFEFSGKTKCGKRVMGMIAQGALATLVKADNHLLWEIPGNWTLKDAATVPVVYGTCLYALVVVGQIKSSDTILIHSGTGGIGQAAINLCLSMGCTVFTTVGTDDKKMFILKNFPEIKERHIGNSRDLSFEQMIMKETKGRGVDIVLNSLAEEKLFASTRCLAENGRFLEIGKFDLANNNQLNLLSSRRGTSYHGVMLDKLFNESSSVKEKLKSLLQEYIDSGSIKPLMSNIFERNEVEQAFRYMAAGKHMGKVLIKIRTETKNDLGEKLTFKGLPRYFCNPEKTYIICGGLGGFGLELADWLVLRGAKNLVLTSRKGITTGYQNYRISIWRSYCCNVRISTKDITTKSGCIELIREANDLAPVGSIFNLAVVLQDSILENQTEQSFETAFGPKAYATEYLDEVTRLLCPTLRDFVVFSSVSCGRGNAGQSNYGMSNSVMERICENRRQEGYPALAIQWGAIGDVGLVAEMQEDHIELEIGGTLQQSISNCLQVMDVLLRQQEASIVSSMVVAEKRLAVSGKIEEVIGAILGIRDIKLVSMQSTLAELGMDSITAIEVKQTLETEYNIFLLPSEMRRITLARIKELQEESSAKEENIIQSPDDIFDLINIVMKSNVSMESAVCKLKTKNRDETNKDFPRIIALPGIEGVCDILENLTENLEVDACGLNYLPSNQTDSIQEMAKTLLPFVIDLLDSCKSFHLIAHSVGSLVALELVSKLEELGYFGSITVLDGSPSFFKKLLNNVLQKAGDLSESGLENTLLASSLALKLNAIDLTSVMKDICECSCLLEKLKIGMTKLNLDGQFSEEALLSSAVATINRYKACLSYIPSFEKVKSKVRLFKPTIFTVNMDSEDYDLSQYCENPVEIKIFEGTHNSFLKNKEMAEAIMENLAVFDGPANQ